jgi:small subunit ribosomal protein S13
MAYFLDTYMNENKKIKNNFKKIIGISDTKLNKICKHFGVKNSIKFLKLPNKLKAQIKNYIENNIETGEAIIIKKMNQIDIYTKIGSYRGSRARNNLPRRGQRTHTNSKTIKRNKI